MGSDGFAELDPARDEATHAITNATTWRPLTTRTSPIHRRTSMRSSLSCKCSDSTYIGKSNWCKRNKIAATKYKCVK